MTVPFYTNPLIVSANSQPPTSFPAPTLLLMSQASGIAVASVVAPNTVVGSPLVAMQMFRSVNGGEPVQVDQKYFDANSVWVNLFDLTPEYGNSASYTVRAVAMDGTTGPFSPAQAFTAFENPYPLTPAYGISAGAYGLYPVLGSDLFINPYTSEAVIGPNGDLMTVNGLECWAQDLRCRILSELGDLPLHPTFGLFKGRTIGSGQSDPAALASVFRTYIVDCIMADPRTYSVESVQIVAPSFDSWTIAYSAYAIGVEDALNANLVYPFYTASSN